MKKNLFIICCFLFVFCGFAQNKEIDSLKRALKVSENNIDRMTLFSELAQAHIYKSTDVFMQYNDSLYELSKQLNDLDMQMMANYNYSVVYRMKGDYEKAIELQKEYIPFISKKQDTLKIAKSYYQLGANYVRLDRNEEAIINLTKALKYADAIHNKSLSSKILNAKAIIYKNMGQLEKAKSIYNSAIEINKKLKDTSSLAIIYNGKGIVLLKQDSINKALELFNTSLKYGEIAENIALVSYQYRNIGTVLKEKKNYQEAEKYHFKALEIRRKVKQELAIGGSLNDLGEIYLETNQLDKSEKHFLGALTIFKKLKAITSQNFIYDNLSKLYTKKGNFKKANLYLKKFHIIKDSLNNNDLREKINKIDIKYETEKKDKELIEKQLILEKNEKELQKNKTQYSYMTGAALLLLVTSILLWFLYQQRQKRKNQEILTLKREHQVQTLESLMEGEEKERFRIAKELHDGVNGDLSAIKFKLSSLLEMNNSVIKEAVTMIDKSCQQVRAISHNLVPPSLQDFNLIEALEEYCTNMNAIHSPKISFQQLGDAIILNKKQEANVFRIVQELVNNSIKHAQADEINVQISSRKSTIQLTVEDNGKGYDQKTIKTDGIGLKNIQSRVAYLNATLDLISNTQGTSTTIEIEIDKLSEN